jgi:hypothetical protein
MQKRQGLQLRLCLDRPLCQDQSLSVSWAILDQRNGGQAAGHLSAEARLHELRADKHLLGFGSQARQEIIYEGGEKT